MTRRGADAGESAALLGSYSDCPTKVLEPGDGHASLLSCISNLANTIVGTGMLTFPLAMASGGIIPGIITCIVSGLVSAFSLYLLSLCATQAPHRRSSFSVIAEMTFPRAAVFFDAAIAIKCFGVSISYLIVLKGLMPNVVKSMFHVLTPPSTHPPPWAVDGSIWLIFFAVFLIPLAYLRRLHSMRHSSYVSLFSVGYLVTILIVCYIRPPKGMPKPGDVHWINLSPNFVSTFPIQVFAFTCAQNLFSLYNEVERNSQRRMNFIIVSGISFATFVYEIIGVIGYLTFGSEVGANVVAMYPSNSLFIACGQLAIVFLVMFSYPLQVHPCRNSLDKVLSFNQRNGFKPIPGTEDSEDPDENEEIGDTSLLKHGLLTSAVVTGGFAIAYFFDNLQMVLSFVGSTGSTTISFILPGLLYWKLTRNDTSKSWLLNKAALGLAVYGGLIFLLCLGFNLYQLSNGGFVDGL